MANEGMQLHRLSAQEQVFAKGDLVFLFKDCFTVHNFACNKTFRTYAEKGQVDIKPVAVRANVDLRAYEAYDASRCKAKMQIAEIEWPTRLDPTARIIFKPQSLFENALNNVVDLTLMSRMLQTNAAHIKRLKIRMALGARVPGSAQMEPQYDHIKMFLEAFAKCTAVETLTIEQSDHVAKEAKLSSVQFRMFQILQNMKDLKVLDFNGNVTLDAIGVDLEDNVRHNLSLVDFLPRSVCEFNEGWSDAQDVQVGRPFGIPEGYATGDAQPQGLVSRSEENRDAQQFLDLASGLLGDFQAGPEHESHHAFWFFGCVRTERCGERQYGGCDCHAPLPVHGAGLCHRGS